MRATLVHEAQALRHRIDQQHKMIHHMQVLY
jgi:hypothetical protein